MHIAVVAAMRRQRLCLRQEHLQVVVQMEVLGHHCNRQVQLNLVDTRQLMNGIRTAGTLVGAEVPMEQKHAVVAAVTAGMGACFVSVDGHYKTLLSLTQL